MILKVIFYGSSNYCLPILESLRKNFNLLAVITKPDQKVGRKQILTPTESKVFALKNNIGLFTPANKIELMSLQAEMEKLEPDIAVVADYGLIIPEEIINIPKYKTVNIHFSRLPDLRGASPVQFTILRGDKSAWITYMLMDKGLDTGDILMQTEYPVNKLSNDQITTGKLYKKLFEMASEELPGLLTDYIKGNIKPMKQNDEKSTYTRILTRLDGYIQWELIYDAIGGKKSGSFPKESILCSSIFSDSSASLLIERAIRGFKPWPGVWTMVKINNQDKRLKILKAHLEGEKLLIDEVQMEGKNPVSWNKYTESYPIE